MSLIELNDVGANGVEYSGGQSLSRNTKNTGELGGGGETVRINFIGTLEDSQQFIATKQMLNQEKGH